MVQQAFQRHTNVSHSYFEHEELSEILATYAERVSANEWRNYSIICGENRTSFVVLDNGTDIASISKSDTGQFKVECKKYQLETSDFLKALNHFKTDFGNKLRQNVFRVVS